VKHENWRKAMDDEINALVQTGTWEFAYLLIGKQTVGCKWLYKLNTRLMAQFRGSRLG